MRTSIQRLNWKKHLLVILLSGLIGCYFYALVLSPKGELHPFFDGFPAARPLTIAHRGGSLLWPENTLLAFQGAADLGADILEMDVHLSADGIPVVIHDFTVDRTTNGSGPVSGFTLEALQQLDAAHGFRGYDDAMAYLLRGTGVTVPTLEQVFQAFPEHRMIVEIKENDPRLAEAVVALLKQYQRESTTLLGSFHPNILQYVRTHHPAIATHASKDEVLQLLVFSWLFLEGLIAPDYDAALTPPATGFIPVTTSRFIAAANNRGVFSAAWTINDPDELGRLATNGIDGIITDRPDLVIALSR